MVQVGWISIGDAAACCCTALLGLGLLFSSVPSSCIYPLGLSICLDLLSHSSVYPFILLPRQLPLDSDLVGLGAWKLLFVYFITAIAVSPLSVLLPSPLHSPRLLHRFRRSAAQYTFASTDLCTFLLHEDIHQTKGRPRQERRKRKGPKRDRDREGEISKRLTSLPPLPNQEFHTARDAQTNSTLDRSSVWALRRRQCFPISLTNHHCPRASTQVSGSTNQPLNFF